MLKPEFSVVQKYTYVFPDGEPKEIENIPWEGTKIPDFNFHYDNIKSEFVCFSSNKTMLTDVFKFQN